MQSLIPSPLHPALVHFPIVLAVLLPLVAALAFWAIRRGAPARRAWLAPLAVAAGLALSAWLAVETGEGDEDRAEAAVGQHVLEGHEEAAERFLGLSVGMLALAAAGLLGGRLGRTARGLGIVASVGLIVAVIQVGHTGGRIVYGDPATRAAGVSQPPAVAGTERAADDDD
ncbi:MAG TPA: DUF2231 domain-containing protein [Gemmatimonadales bacterium]|nr:DUF2231 domain-containing protein [Gemmatimonadales bacterium]